VSDAKRVWVVVVIWELCALPMFVVRFKYVKEETTAPNGLCDLKKPTVIIYLGISVHQNVCLAFNSPSLAPRRKRGK